MSSTRFIIISTAYNKGKWIESNVVSIKQQSYSNFKAYYGYDKSTDNTLQYLSQSIGDDDRFEIVYNKTSEGFLSNFMNVYSYLKTNNLIQPQDVVVEVDGDDWLLHPFVLQYLNDVYQDPNIWMTYGQYIQYPTGDFGGHIHLELDDLVDKHNAYRQATFPYSHLKTFKAFLLENLTDDDLIDPITGKYFNAAADFALCMPLVEQAGKSRIFRVNEPLYVYNLSQDLESETNNRLALQKEVELRIRQVKPKNKI